MTTAYPYVSEHYVRLLAFVDAFQREHAYMPPIKRLVSACDYASHGSALRAIKALVARGDLARGRDGYRSIKVADQGRQTIRGGATRRSPPKAAARSRT